MKNIASEPASHRAHVLRRNAAPRRPRVWRRVFVLRSGDAGGEDSDGLTAATIASHRRAVNVVTHPSRGVRYRGGDPL
jgi:hypothetical protein